MVFQEKSNKFSVTAALNLNYLPEGQESNCACLLVLHHELCAEFLCGSF